MKTQTKLKYFPTSRQYILHVPAQLDRMAISQSVLPNLKLDFLELIVENDIKPKDRNNRASLTNAIAKRPSKQSSTKTYPKDCPKNKDNATSPQESPTHPF